MPVRYSGQSSGPSTRRARGNTWAGGGETVAVTSSSQMSKAALVALAKERGLSASGSKKDLIYRLAGVIS